MENRIIKFSKNQIICKDGDLDFDLYRVLKGKLMICKRNQKSITPIAYLTAGEYFGEMSFFDKKVRSADVIALEESELEKIPEAQLKKNFPIWLLSCAKNMTKKLRLINESINAHGIKRSGTGTIEPLSMDKQRFFLGLFDTEN